MQKYNLLIVEDHPYTRDTLCYQIKKLETINLMGAVTNGLEAVDFVLKQKPDIILIPGDLANKRDGKDKDIYCNPDS